MRRGRVLGVLLLGMLALVGVAFVFWPTAAAPLSADASRTSFPFIGSVDTMKLSKDKAADNLDARSINQAVDAAARSMRTTHVTVDTPLEYPGVMSAWARRIHADGKHVWFRLGSMDCNQPHGDLGDGYPRFRHGYLTELHSLMVANAGLFRTGDVLDGDAEAENSCWWANHYGCAVQASCNPCNTTGSNRPCAPIRQFVAFFTQMTRQENRDLASIGVSGVITTVHSTDPGTATTILTPGFVRSMGNLITVDAYPDEGTTDPGTAVRAWKSSLRNWHRIWLDKGVDVSILVGEWGYPNLFNVGQAIQEAVVRAEVTQAFPMFPYLAGANYWVGPGFAGDGGYTQIFRREARGWELTPAAREVSHFYSKMMARPAPAITSLRLSPSVFIPAGPRRGNAIVDTGTTITYRANQASTATFTVLKIVSGVRRGDRCVAAASRPRDARARCARTIALASFSRTASKKGRRFRFDGLLHRRPLEPGSYWLKVIAVLGALRSEPVDAAFLVARR